MANKYTKLFGAFKRLQNFPLDPSSFYETYEEALEYSQQSKVAYKGQLIVVTSGERSGLYRVVESDKPSETGLTLSERAVENDTLNEEISKLGETVSNLGEVLDKVSEKVDAISGDYLTKGDLGDEINSIIGDALEEIEQINGAVDTIQEISVWIKEHEGILGSLSHIQSQFENIESQLSDRPTKTEVNESLIGLRDEFDGKLSGYATKEEITSLSAVLKRYSFEFGAGKANGMIIPSGHIITKITVVYYEKAGHDLGDTISLDLPNGNPVDFSQIDFSEEITADPSLGSLNLRDRVSYIFNIEVPIHEDSELRVNCEDFDGCYGEILIELVKIA